MALTIAIEGLGVLDNAEATTNFGIAGSGGASISLDNEIYYQGAGSISSQISSGKWGWIYYNHGTTLDFTSTYDGQYVYLWCQTVTPGAMNTLATPGFSVRMGTDTSNYREWAIAGNDDLNGWDGGWRCIVIDPTSAGTSDSGTYSAATVQYIGIQYDGLTAARAANVFLDTVAVGSGIRAKGTETTSGEGLKEIADYCTARATRAWGMIQEREGVYYLYGNLILGATDANTTVSDKNRVFQFGNSEYYSGSAWITSMGDNFNGLTIEDHASYTTSFTDGIIVGSDGGRSGCIWIGHPNISTTFDYYGGNNAASLTKLYGVSLKGITGGIVWGNDSDHECFSVTFEGCGQFDPVGAPIIRNCSFTGTAAFPYFFHRAIMDDGGSYTDETTDINDVDVGDVNLLPATMATDDAFYFASMYKFDIIHLIMSTATDAATVLAWEFWNGSSWTALSGLSDGTDNFQKTGPCKVTFTLPSTWETSQLWAYEWFYYIRARVTTAGTTRPIASYGYPKGPGALPALLWNPNADIQKCSFLANTDDDNNPGGIESPDASESLGLTDMTFSGNDVDFVNTAFGAMVSAYDWSYQDTDVDLNGTNNIAGQVNTNVTSGKLCTMRFYLKSTLSPTGNMYAELYATSGGTPTGAALATSNTIDASTVGTTYSMIDFEFEDEYTLAATTDYAYVINYSGGDGSNYISVGVDNSGPGHAGVGWLYTASWASQTWDCVHFATRSAFIQINSTDSNPSTAEQRAYSAPTQYSYPGATKIVSSVNLTITVKDEAGVAVQDAQTSIYTDDGNKTELMNEDTLSSGIAQEAYNYVGDQDIVIKVRKASGGTNYVNFSTLGKIESGGYTLLVTLVEDPNNAT